MLLAAVFDAAVQWAGRTTSRGFMVGVVFLLAATFLAHGAFAFGWGKTLVYLGLGFGVPYLAEAVGLRTGFPFGRYRYTGFLGSLLPFGVPTYVVLAWVLLLYSSIFAAKAFAIVVPLFQNDYLHVLFVCFLMVAIDGLIDPVAVKNGHWAWANPGRWFDVPATNFLGWFLTTALTMTALILIFGRMKPITEPTPHWLYYLPVLMFGFLNLHFIGLLRKIGLGRLFPLAMVLAMALISLYVVSVIQGVPEL